MSDGFHVDDAFDFLVRKLVDVPEYQSPNSRPEGYNLKISDIANAYWWERSRKALQEVQSPEIDPYYQSFYDAAWKLCRMGVLRPGLVTRTLFKGPGFDGDGYSLTMFGRAWVKSVEPRPTSDPWRFGSLLAEFEARFGSGYGQRACEAVDCYQTGNYLACCVLSGAAAESILLAIAIAKSGDEEKVVAEYRTASGRRKITDRIVGNVTKPIAEHFKTGLNIIGFWRDEAGHGLRSTISEIEAYGALSQLIRLAQFSSDNWSTLTH